MYEGGYVLPTNTINIWFALREWVKVTQSCPILETPWTVVHGMLQARILEWVAFPFSRDSFQPRDWTQVSLIYQLNHKGRPRILEWMAYPFPRGSSWPRNWTRVSCIAGGLFTNWAIREAFALHKYMYIRIIFYANPSYSQQSQIVTICCHISLENHLIYSSTELLTCAPWRPMVILRMEKEDYQWGIWDTNIQQYIFH